MRDYEALKAALDAGVAELGRLDVVMAKTAGPRERAAMDCVRAHVRAALGDG